MINKKTIFLIEQEGEMEREFKTRITALLQHQKVNARAYLARVQYGDEQDNHVALCIRTDSLHPQDIVSACMDVFKSMFTDKDHVDIVLLTHRHEQTIRQICCPFYTSPDYLFSTPDFYLFSTEGYNLDDIPRACYKRKRLYGKDRRDGFMLCDISPPIIGQRYGLGDKDIHQVVIANRLQMESLFPVSNWPICVYVTRILNENIESISLIQEEDIAPIGWAELYKNKDDMV